MTETVLGVQFPKIEGLTNAHFGRFWSFLGSDWSDAKPADLHPIPPVHERFGAGVTWGNFQMQLSADASSRLQLRREDRMVQVQNGRLHYNWIGSGDQYPRYRNLRPEFLSLYERFEAFLNSEGFGELKIRPDHWEVTYVNHIPRGTVWTEPADWKELFVELPGPFPRLSSVSFESFGGHWQYEIVPTRGRLHVEIQHAQRQDGEEALVMTLTARGPIKPDLPSPEAVLSGLDLGRETIVSAFKAMTSERAHKVWRIIP